MPSAGETPTGAASRTSAGHMLQARESLLVDAREAHDRPTVEIVHARRDHGETRIRAIGKASGMTLDRIKISGSGRMDRAKVTRNREQRRTGIAAAAHTLLRISEREPDAALRALAG